MVVVVGGGSQQLLSHNPTTVMVVLLLGLWLLLGCDNNFTKRDEIYFEDKSILQRLTIFSEVLYL